MILTRMVTIQLVEDFDNVGVGIGPRKGVACAIETQDELVWLLIWVVLLGPRRHFRRNRKTNDSYRVCVGMNRKREWRGAEMKLI